MAHVHVKILGVFRLDTGLHEVEADAVQVKDLFPILLEKAREIYPDTPVTLANLNGCIILVNGKQSKKGTRLADGDTVHLMSPVCGG